METNTNTADETYSINGHTMTGASLKACRLVYRHAAHLAAGDAVDISSSTRRAWFAGNALEIYLHLSTITAAARAAGLRDAWKECRAVLRVLAKQIGVRTARA